MSNKATLIIIVAILAVLAGGMYVIKNQRATIREIPNLGTNETSQTTESPAAPSVKPADVKQDATSMVTQISQITLTVSSPVNNSTVTTAKVVVKGKTLPKAEVFVNEAEGVADGNGNFSLSVNLDEGSNDIIVTAVDAEGNVAETVVTVTYNQGE